MTSFVLWRNGVVHEAPEKKKGHTEIKCLNCLRHCQRSLNSADSDTVSTYQVSSVQLVTDKKLEAFNKA